MGIAENKKIVDAFYEASNRGDVESCLALLADDVKWTNIGSTKYSGTCIGKADLTAKLLGPVFGQLKAGITATVDNVIAEDDFVAVQLRGKAETKDGRPYNNTYCHVFQIHDGKVCEVTEYFDTELASSVLTG
jgi:ketosteroid isomerase-like protein